MSQSKNHKKYRHGHKRTAWPMLLLLGGGVLLIIGAIFALRKPSQASAEIAVSGRPSIKVDTEKVDLGDVKLGRTVEVDFEITNVGDQTLRFTKTPFVEVLEGC
jgi:hypothetical protein